MVPKIAQNLPQYNHDNQTNDFTIKKVNDLNDWDDWVIEVHFKIKNMY